MIQKIGAVVLLTLVCASASATVSVTSSSFTYSQNFNTLGNDFTNPWTNDSTIVGWSLFTSTLAAPPTYRGEFGNQDVGSFVSYGASASDRALGAIGDSNSYFGSPANGAIAGYIAVSFANNSGVTLNSFTLGFKGEEWRYANAPAQTMVLEYGFGSTFAAVASWVVPGGNFDWASPRFGPPGAGGIDGNGQGAVLGRGGMASVSWAPDQNLWIRWVERNDVGADHGLAIDDLTFSVTAVPEPSQAALMLAGAAAIFSVVRRRRQ